jgi:RNA polymerase sigma factor (sigma-70 family)
MTERPSPLTSPTLLARLREGENPLAWDEFFGIYGPLLWACARRRGCSADTAEDLVQDVMLKVFEGRDVFRYDPSRGRFRDWLGTVVRNRIAERRRSPQERARPDGDASAGPAGLPFEPASPEPGPDAAWEEDFERALLAAALDIARREAEPRDYLAFELTELEGVDPALAAATAGITRNAVYKARRRIVARLRETVGPYPDDGSLTRRLRDALLDRPTPAAERSLSARIGQTSRAGDRA